MGDFAYQTELEKYTKKYLDSISKQQISFIYILLFHFTIPCTIPCQVLSCILGTEETDILLPSEVICADTFAGLVLLSPPWNSFMALPFLFCPYTDPVK